MSAPSTDPPPPVDFRHSQNDDDMRWVGITILAVACVIAWSTIGLVIFLFLR